MGIIVVYQTHPDLNNQYLKGRQRQTYTQKVYYDFPDKEALKQHF